MKLGLFNSLKLKKEIIEIKKYGIPIKGNCIDIKYLKKETNKATFITTKKLGNAVIRNKIKNQLRHIIRNNEIFAIIKVHLLIKANKIILKQPFQEIKKEMEKTLFLCYKKINEKS